MVADGRNILNMKLRSQAWSRTWAKGPNEWAYLRVAIHELATTDAGSRHDYDWTDAFATWRVLEEALQPLGVVAHWVKVT